MNYRHIYHAGNFADVVKHLVLTMLLQKLREKETPFSVIDTHAGIGLYDLNSIEALKTKESEKGISKLLSIKEDSVFKDYLDIVRKQKKGFYPGSPIITHSFLRKDDRLWLSELHPEDYKSLSSIFKHNRQVKVLHQDGYLSLKALLPPKEKRSLILIDPPFEDRNEFIAILKGIKEGYKRFPTGIYLIWFPIKTLKTIKNFYTELKKLGILKILAIEFLCKPALTENELNGTGLILINPPWKIEEKISSGLEELLKILELKKGYVHIEWLVGEKSASL